MEKVPRKKEITEKVLSDAEKDLKKFQEKRRRLTKKADLIWMEIEDLYFTVWDCDLAKSGK